MIRALLIFLLIQIVCFADNIKVDNPLIRSYGTFAGAPRKKNGHIDTKELLSQLIYINANTYNWLLSDNDNDWQDLKEFLLLSSPYNISIWVTVLPPSGKNGRKKFFSMPYKTNYLQWGQELAKLSIEFPNLVAWSIDDFSENTKVLTPKKMKMIIKSAKKINPSLLFVPRVFYSDVNKQLTDSYRGLFDGVLFPYRSESHGIGLLDPNYISREIAYMKRSFLLPVIVEIYASAYGNETDTTPDYLYKALMLAQKHADGMHIRNHQSDNSRKNNIIKSVFSRLQNSFRDMKD